MNRCNSLSGVPLDVASSWQFPHCLVKMTEIIAVTNKNFSLIQNLVQRASLHSKQDTLRNQGLHGGLHKQQQLAESHTKKKGATLPSCQKDQQKDPVHFFWKKPMMETCLLALLAGAAPFFRFFLSSFGSLFVGSTGCLCGAGALGLGNSSSLSVQDSLS